jgi:hypothetical protein
MGKKFLGGELIMDLVRINQVTVQLALIASPVQRYKDKLRPCLIPNFFTK